MLLFSTVCLFLFSIACIEAQSLYEIREFEDTLDGSIVLPSDSDYKKTRVIWNNRRVGTRPRGFILPQSPEDVVKAVHFLNSHHLKFRVKSGGHCFTGWNQRTDQWVISTARLSTLTVDADEETVVMGAGLRFKAIYTALHSTGLLFPGGTCPTVGVSGFLLGGGHSVLSRSLGIASDSLLSMRVVTASGDLLTVSDTQHSDLFWALRGAGHNNFGVVVVHTPPYIFSC
jgi:FAD/FMN-containing dehydrogenase